MLDDHTPEQIEQLARSLAMNSAMTDTDRLTVVELLRQFARQAHPTARREVPQRKASGGANGGTRTGGPGVLPIATNPQTSPTTPPIAQR